MLLTDCATRPAIGFVASVLVAMLWTGCVRQPPRVEAPRWDPAGLAASAIQQLDTNGDGVLSIDEVRKAAPGLAAAWKRLDVDNDSRVTAEELAARFRLYQDMRTGLRSQVLRVRYAGRPLANATIRLIPEPFLGDTIEPAGGMTDTSGNVMVRSDSADIPAVRLGFYRVEITSDSVRIPPKYNVQSTLGVEISPVSDGDDSSGMILLDLT